MSKERPITHVILMGQSALDETFCMLSVILCMMYSLEMYSCSHCSRLRLSWWILRLQRREERQSLLRGLWRLQRDALRLLTASGGGKGLVGVDHVFFLEFLYARMKCIPDIT